MKVFLPAIAGLVPPRMVQAVSEFMEFCYLVRRSQIDEVVLRKIDAAVQRFHDAREIFREEGIHTDFCLPRQHSITHYRQQIQMFGAPNGLCSSITESKHIKAVKQPWRRSNRNQPLGQMLLTNQRLDKLAALRVELDSRGMLKSASGNPTSTRSSRPFIPPSPPPREILENDADDSVDQEDVEGITSEGDVRLPKRPGMTFTCVMSLACGLTDVLHLVPGYPKHIPSLAHHLQVPKLEQHIRRFLYDQLNPDSDIFGMDVELDACPTIPLTLRLKSFHSAAATYHAPSDLSGIGGMHREHIRASPMWQRSFPRYDCVFVERDPDEEGFRALGVAQVLIFFSFKYDGITYPCALVRWFETYGDAPCPLTGMWRVQPDIDGQGVRVCSVIHIDSILRAAHLIGVYGKDFIPHNLRHYHSLSAFKLYYVNKYADHHSHEIAF